LRKPHVLKGNKCEELPPLAIYFDSESHVNPETLVHSPYLVMACFVDYYRRKEKWREYGAADIAQFWRDVAKHGGGRQGKGRVWLYAHNMFYDLVATGGIAELLKLGFKVVNFHERGKVFILRMRRFNNTGKTEKTLEFISTTNYFAESLASLGKSLNLSKLDFDFTTGTLEQARIYCKRDVEIVKLSVENFRGLVKDEGLGNMARTLPGQAFNAYKHRFMATAIFIHDNENALRLERAAYAGGRVECFRLGALEGEFYGLDINGMYPHVMTENLYPVRLCSYRQRITLANLQWLLQKGYLMIARCRVAVNTPSVGLKHEGEYLFPVGEFWGAFSTPEIVYLLARGEIHEVGEVSIYEAAPIFTDYMRYFLGRRAAAKREGDLPKEKMYKLFANSLYGKWGQTGEVWEKVGIIAEHIIGEEVVVTPDGARERHRYFGGGDFILRNETEGHSSFPAIAAHVTAYARMATLTFMQTAGRENVLYTDTDSLFVTRAGRDNLAPYLDELKPGYLKVEKEGTHLEIFAPKDYVFAGTVKRKGIRGDAVPAGAGYRMMFWPKLSHFVRAGHFDYYQNLERTKQLARVYKKGTVGVDGVVVPYTFSVDGAGANVLVEHAQERQAEMEAWAERQIRGEYKAEFRRLRQEIMVRGGVNDVEFNHLLPAHIKRKRGGVSLDVLAHDLRSAGFPVADGEELLYAITSGREGRKITW